MARGKQKAANSAGGVIAGCNLGYNGYADPTTLGPRQWFGASHVYSGQHGTIRRARLAPVVDNTTSGYAPSGKTFDSLYNFRDPTPQYLLLGDNNKKLWSFNMPGAYAATQRFNPYIDPLGTGIATMIGPWMRASMLNQVFEQNGQVKQTGRGTNAAIVENWGLDAPDASIGVTLAAGVSKTIAAPAGGVVCTSNIVTITTTANHTLTVGEYVNLAGITDTTFNTLTGAPVKILTVPSPTTFTYSLAHADATSGNGTVTLAITKTIGRSYSFAWENSGNTNISAPSPATQYVVYNAQIGTLTCVQPGTLNAVVASTTVTGTGTAFTSAWVGRRLWISGLGGSASTRVTNVASPTSLTIDTAITIAGGNSFQIYDLQSTNIRLYATADGGANYFRIQRNAFDPTQTTALLAGLVFTDNDNSEPPNGNFTTELVQSFNVPPPIGKYVYEYQSRLITFGVPAALQTFYYSNIELTLFGLPPACFAPLNQVTLPIGSASVNGCAGLPTGLLVWSDKHDMFKVTGTFTDNSISTSTQLGATIQRLPYALGCISPTAVTVTPLGVLWMTSDYEIYLFTDNYAPRNVGRPIQNILNNIRASRANLTRMVYIHDTDKNWVAVSFTTSSYPGFNLPHANCLVILDLDMLSSNGSPSFFVFDMATNQPSWYIYPQVCDGLTSAVESTGVNRLLTSDLSVGDTITDNIYATGKFVTASGETPISDGQVILHAFGNDSPNEIKTLEWVRFITNRSPSVLQSDGWVFGYNLIDDDVYTIASPNVVTLTPGVNSAVLGAVAANPTGISGNVWPGLTTARALEFSPAYFVTRSALSPSIGRRFQFFVTFPSTIGVDYEFRNLQLMLEAIGD